MTDAGEKTSRRESGGEQVWNRARVKKAAGKTMDSAADGEIATKKVSISFLDNVFPPEVHTIDASTTVGAVCIRIREKLGLVNDSDFGIFETNVEQGKCMMLDDEETIWRVTNEWRKYGLQEMQLVYRLWFAGGFADEEQRPFNVEVREATSPEDAAHKLEFHQAIHQYRKGWLKWTEADDRIANARCIELAALQLQDEIGDYNPVEHKKGFTQKQALLTMLIPHAMLRRLKQKKRMWKRAVETDLIEAFAKLQGMNSLEAQQGMLQLFKTSHMFGAVVFTPLQIKISTNERFNAQVLAINESGFSIITRSVRCAAVRWRGERAGVHPPPGWLSPPQRTYPAFAGASANTCAAAYLCRTVITTWFVPSLYIADPFFLSPSLIPCHHNWHGYRRYMSLPPQ